MNADLLLLAARKAAELAGPLTCAGDETDAQLAAARVNAELLVLGWCRCQDPTGPKTEEAYYQHKDGRHGWMCTRCRRITQTG